MIPISDPILEGKELEYVTECIKTGWISSQGAFVKKFESELASFVGKKYGVSCSSGTTALHLALESLGIKEGDEVIVPSFSFVAVGNTVRYCKATPVFVDIDKVTWNMAPEEIEKKITGKTKAIMAVHTYGHPCEMEEIAAIAKKYKLYLVENVAEALGAEYKGRKVGSFGDVSCFSFFANKVITTGEGGMCLTDNERLAEKIRILRDHGLPPLPKHVHERYKADVIGFNYRMTNLQAAVGLAQLEQINGFIEKKIKNAKYYNNLLKGIEGVTTPIEKPYVKNIYWLYTIFVDDKFPIGRDKLIEMLIENGMDCRPVYYPINEMPTHNDSVILPVTHELSKQGINLPSSPKLTKEEIEKIVAVIKKATQ